MGQAKLPEVEVEIKLDSPLEKVWSVLENPDEYIQRLDPRVLTYELDPPGRISVGQKVHTTVLVRGNRNAQSFSEVTEVVPKQKIVNTHTPNRLFAQSRETLTLEPVKDGTLVRVRVDYEPNGLRAKILSVLFARRVLSKNIRTTLFNLRRLVESDELSEQ